MQTRHFQTKERALFYARNMPREAFRISPNVDGLHVLTWRAPNETSAELDIAHADACAASVESNATRAALERFTRAANPRLPDSELARLRRENAEMRRTLGTLADALENHASYKANFLNLMVRNARTLIGA